MQTVSSRAALKSLPLMKTGSRKSVIFRYSHLPVVWLLLAIYFLYHHDNIQIELLADSNSFVYLRDWVFAWQSPVSPVYQSPHPLGILQPGPNLAGPATGAVNWYGFGHFAHKCYQSKVNPTLYLLPRDAVARAAVPAFLLEFRRTKRRHVPLITSQIFWHGLMLKMKGDQELKGSTCVCQDSACCFG